LKICFLKGKSGAMFTDLVKNILHEINDVLIPVRTEEVDAFIHEIVGAKTIVVVGAGRVGMAIRGFGMRLGHLGLHAFTLGDSTVPHIGEHDLLLIASGSGETQTVYDIAVLGKNNGARIGLVTGRADSRIAKLADVVVLLKAPSKGSSIEGISSLQPMTTLNEQCLQIFFDAVVLLLIKELNQDQRELWARHSNLE
jgi:6-phospho-3-hexuloisomerase